MSPVNVISANLPVLRELCGLSQLELGQRVNASRRTIARIEAGDVSDPGVELMQRIAEALGVTLELLIAEPLVAAHVAVPKRLHERLVGGGRSVVLQRMIRAGLDG